MTDEVKKFTQCVLKSRNYKHKNVELAHNVPIIIGRGPQTRIRNRKCSKNQVEITADFVQGYATVIQLGENPSEVCDKLLPQKESVIVFDGSDINLLKDQLQYTLEFVPAPKGICDIEPDSSSNQENQVSSENSELAIAGGSKSPPSKKARFVAGNEEACDAFNTEAISRELHTLRNSIASNIESLTTEECWDEYDLSKLLIYTTAGVNSMPKIAAFDMDHTIISTKSGKVFPTSSDDWCIMYPQIPGKLKELNQKGYKIVIFTNQKGISQGRTMVSHFKHKIQCIARKLGVPLQAYVSTGHGNYRKPLTGMWEYLCKTGNKGIPIDAASSIYVGDAAGRVENWAPRKKKDFSCADRLFALNIGVQFFTPEEFFQGQQPAKFLMPSFDPRNIGQKPLAVRYKPTSDEPFIPAERLLSSSQELILFVGFPASGKTHFVRNYLLPKKYSHVNRDVLGTWQKCMAECAKSLAAGKSVVIDNTNPDRQTRARYIECAKKHVVPSRCFLFSCTLEEAKHNNKFRQLMHPDSKHVSVTDMILHSYKNKYEEPALSEGFTEIVHIHFVPKFNNAREQAFYKMFLSEK